MMRNDLIQHNGQAGSSRDESDDGTRLEIPCSDFHSLGFDVLLEIAHRELEPSGDSVMCDSVLFGQPIDVPPCGLQVFGGLVDVKEPFS